MGTELIDDTAIPFVPWLEPSTNAYLHRLVALAVSENSDVEAVILFGSAARNKGREMRPLTAPNPSDVDVLFLMRPGRTARVPSNSSASSEPITLAQHSAISRAVVETLPASPDNSLRHVQTVLADAAFTGWDPSFVRGVQRDGILLWSRAALPAGLAAVEARGRTALRR
jgi:hypothetical protein